MPKMLEVLINNAVLTRYWRYCLWYYGLIHARKQAFAAAVAATPCPGEE